ncbi:hypothetical protein [Candidatus Leptofilum sp.]|uniref:hypothetical protein n=1 Tax=Candidatus Leptofilum sp. TaxID=3241576 RepID=UPI003B5B2167
MISQEAALVEYQALRQEINILWDRRSSRMSLVWATISALVAASALVELPELCILALILVNAGWSDELRWFDSMHRIGAYIHQILEPQIDGLQWENVQEAINRRSPRKYHWLSNLKSTYGLFALSSLSASVFLYSIFYPDELFRHIIFWGFAMIGVVFTASNIRKGIKRQIRRMRWEEEFSAVAKEFQFVNNVETGVDVIETDVSAPDPA